MKNNKLVLVLTAFCLVLGFTACKEEKEEKAEGTTQNAEAQPSGEAAKADMEKTADLKYNPAHGQPGHTCALPVGAPLDQAATTPKMTTSPVRLQDSAPQINPPHGEPGHDCSKPVGSRLDS
ncbi:hypothetical protein [Gramella sp. AN32]|uniref:Secreted protein n=1 Tax=Christiangramia antarctica TaxID=2058158 RepID=A0ABW5X329_9FLAO|nr:hypothetical protein [Gramella sp. AN32]MCM4154861.1 hypothetical protein [Gramella sp. AN32]